MFGRDQAIQPQIMIVEQQVLYKLDGMCSDLKEDRMEILSCITIKTLNQKLLMVQQLGEIHNQVVN